MVLVVLVKEGASVKAMVMFYKALVKAVLLYGGENWVIMNSTMKVMEGFHNCIYLRIVGNMAQRFRAEGCE